jgi:hypothetical protein
MSNGYTRDINGWKYISISGDPKERGYIYGKICSGDFKNIQNMLNYFILESYGYTWPEMIEKINNSIASKIKNNYREFYDEMVGIADGCNSQGTETTIGEIIAWNFYMSISYWYSTINKNSSRKEGGSNDKCSAFIAVGDYTQNGDIVVGHNSFTEFIDGQYLNVILDLTPTKGARFIMQTAPCWIWSGSDFFVTSYGIIGTETTIGGFMPYENNIPIFCRIRHAMQYGKTLDDYVDILINNNSGDYANSWLFGDINTNEILRLELGLKYTNTERTKNGYFIGFNSTYDPRIRNFECANSGFYDIRRHQGSRRVRLNDLIDKHKGKLNINIAKNIISDHYDVYLNKENPCSRTVCSHYELDKREFMSQSDRPVPFSPRGAVDGIVCDSTLARNMSFVAKYGSSCDIAFDREAFCNKHRQWIHLKPYLNDRPAQPWTTFTINVNNKKNPAENKTIKNKKGNKYNKTYKK